MNGLDDLRGWTLSGVIQSHVDVYLTDATFTEVKRSFPYLVSCLPFFDKAISSKLQDLQVNKEFASGGGDVCLLCHHVLLFVYLS
jgi:hypothetical protein